MDRSPKNTQVYFFLILINSCLHHFVSFRRVKAVLEAFTLERRSGDTYTHAVKTMPPRLCPTSNNSQAWRKSWSSVNAETQLQPQAKEEEEEADEEVGDEDRKRLKTSSTLPQQSSSASSSSVSAHILLCQFHHAHISELCKTSGKRGEESTCCCSSRQGTEYVRHHSRCA